MSGQARSVLMPLVLVWLAIHAAVLAAILGLKFLTAKAVVLLLLLGGALWLVLGRPRRTALPPPHGMV